MTTEDDILSFMDLLDLDEELIDQRLKAILKRDSFSVKHLSNALHLLKYKHLINVREDTDIENNEECNFIAKLIANLKQNNIEYVCKITNVVLCLNRPSLTSKSEHLLQQILTDLFDHTETLKEEEKYANALLKLKICSSVLDAVISNGQKVSLLFFETPLEDLLNVGHEQLKNYFITNTIPRLFKGVLAYNILDRISTYIHNQTGDNQYMALKIISCLADYFLPVADKKGDVNFESDIIFQSKFWELILFGLNSVEAAHRKISIYLAKRSIDSITARNCNIKIKSQLGVVIFDWESKNEKLLKLQWENFFILIESLEEKQSNIVLPSLQLFDGISKIGREWFNSALKIGLKHDNMLIKQTCIMQSIDNHITCIQEAKMLLEALNDINLFHSEEGILNIVTNLTNLCQNEDNFIRIFQTIPLIKWSPVPLYYVTFSLFEIRSLQDFCIDNNTLVSMVAHVLKTPCNNVIIRKYVHIFVFIIFKSLCRKIDCLSLTNICCTLQSEPVKSNIGPFLIDSWISSQQLQQFYSQDLIDFITKSPSIDVLFQILKKTDSYSDFLVEINKKIEKLQNITARQYCQKSICLTEFIYLASIYEKICNTDELVGLHGIMRKCLLQYILCLILEDTISYTRDINTCINNCQHLLTTTDYDVKDAILKLNSVCLRIFKDSNCDLERKVFSVNILKLLLNNDFICNSQTVTINEIIDATEQLETKNVSQRGNGRLLNNAYEKTCEIIHEMIDNKLEGVHANTSKVLSFIDNVLECGGYGCLKWLLRIMNEILPALEEKETKYDLEKFIKRTWKEIEELKSNNQYTPCIKEFAILITHDVLLRKPQCNNTIILYCKKIIDVGHLTVSPLWFLIENISNKVITSDMAQLVYVLQEILLFAPVIRNDQRILDLTINNILHNNHIEESDPDFHESKEHEYPYACMVQSMSVKTLLNIHRPEIFQSIVSSLMRKIDEIFRNKQRYHENSYHHRVLLLALQHLVFLLLIQPRSVDLNATMNWCLRLLAKLPHQKSIKVYTEWYVSLVLFVKGTPLNAETMDNETFRSIPPISKFVIMYLVLKQRILNGTYDVVEFEFVMEHLLAHTMVQTFNVRLHAQFLAFKLHEMVNLPSQKYDFTLQLISSNFNSNKEERNYKNLVADVFISQSDIISCLRPKYVYNLVPNFYDVFVRIDTAFLPKDDDCLNYLEQYGISSDVTSFWMSKRTCPEIIFNRPSSVEHSQEENGPTGVLQKKYVPWKNMSDVVGCGDIKKESPGDLVVVASLIDKLPNLGGLARTSEVFGVKTYVVDSLRHLQDKQFQGLSVSAERWVDIEEVRPGQPLKDYLLMMKSQGYTAVAAEQTSNSVSLQHFKFPKKTLLLLGHEKEGVPCDLLPLMDHCVEIPQQGLVRSLNVHVTAAIFIWQYYWQNIL